MSKVKECGNCAFLIKGQTYTALWAKYHCVESGHIWSYRPSKACKKHEYKHEYDRLNYEKVQSSNCHC